VCFLTPDPENKQHKITRFHSSTRTMVRVHVTYTSTDSAYDYDMCIRDTGVDYR
jgi:hypothetical protein